MKPILKALTVLIVISSLQSCTKSDSTAATTTPAPTPTFSCTLDGIVFSPTNISGSTGGTWQGSANIVASYSSASVTQYIAICLASPAIGTYTLGSAWNFYNYEYGVPGGGINNAVYDVGPNVTAMTFFNTSSPGGVPQYSGTCIISSNSNNVISGTFSFTVYNPSGTPTTHTIANGSFSNIQL